MRWRATRRKRSVSPSTSPPPPAVPSPCARSRRWRSKPTRVKSIEISDSDHRESADNEGVTMLLACNLGSYGRHREVAWEHLPSIGVQHVEIGVPQADQVEAVRARLAAHGLTASTLQAPCDASSDEGVAQFGRAADVARQMGVKILFVSVKEGEAPRTEVYRRLRAMGDLAGERDVTLAVETHPAVAHNAEAALATMAGVDHPRVRLNFDTGNIYFYNEGADAVAELARVAPYVAAV